MSRSAWLLGKLSWFMVFWWLPWLWWRCHCIKYIFIFSEVKTYCLPKSISRPFIWPIAAPLFLFVRTVRHSPLLFQLFIAQFWSFMYLGSLIMSSETVFTFQHQANYLIAWCLSMMYLRNHIMSSEIDSTFQHQSNFFSLVLTPHITQPLTSSLFFVISPRYAIYVIA